MEIDDKDKLLKLGEVVVDLGATPGGWSQVAVKRVGSTGMVDLLWTCPRWNQYMVLISFKEISVKMMSQIN